MEGMVIGSILSLLIATSSGASATIISPIGVGVTAPVLLATHTISLHNRYPESWVNSVFKKNILLTLGYMRGAVKQGEPISWNEVEKPFHWEFTVNPGKTISFHNNILPKYLSTAQSLLQVHFGSTDGFLSDGYLVGDGVCHLASLLRWVASDAGLIVDSPTNHDFAPIPEIPKEQGVAIYSLPDGSEMTEKQNLYIQNTKEHAILLSFDYDGSVLKIASSELH